MKIVFIVGCLLAVVSAAVEKKIVDEIRGRLLKKMETCATEVHATPDDIATLKSHAVPASHEGKCVMFCMHKIYKLQNEDGSINPEGGISTLDMIKRHDEDLYGKMVTVINTCAKSVVVDSDPCITAANWGECGLKEGKALSIDKYMV